MKTLHTTPEQNVTNNHARVRLALTFAGIVTAVLCSMALLQDIRSAEQIDTGAPRLLESSRTVTASLIGDVKTWL